MSHTMPLWVPAVLVGLLALGVMQSRSRRVLPGVVTAVALGFLGWSLLGVVASFGAGLGALLPWALGIAAALALGRAGFLSRGMVFDAATRRVLVPGSWWPLGLMMGVFGIRFALGTAAGLGAPVVAGSVAAAAAALALGLLSGLFAASAQAVRRAVRRTPAAG